MELVCQLEIAYELGFIEETELQSLHGTTKNVAEKLSSLRRSQLSTLSTQQGT
jgi:hypothetical protein